VSPPLCAAWIAGGHTSVRLIVCPAQLSSGQSNKDNGYSNGQRRMGEWGRWGGYDSAAKYQIWRFPAVTVSSVGRRKASLRVGRRESRFALTCFAAPLKEQGRAGGQSAQHQQCWDGGLGGEHGCERPSVFRRQNRRARRGSLALVCSALVCFGLLWFALVCFGLLWFAFLRPVCRNADADAGAVSLGGMGAIGGGGRALNVERRAANVEQRTLNGSQLSTLPQRLPT
jgi:hypothetical protein